MILIVQSQHDVQHRGHAPRGVVLIGRNYLNGRGGALLRVCRGRGLSPTNSIGPYAARARAFIAASISARP